MDGGHTYIWGKADYPPHGTVDAWAYFDFEDRPQEEEFERSYAGGDLEVESPSWQYFPNNRIISTQHQLETRGGRCHVQGLTKRARANR
jgi:hypothetical protein